VIARAFQLLQWIEQNQTMAAQVAGAPSPRQQLELFPAGRQALLHSLGALDLEAMTPLDALNALHRLQAQLLAEGGAP
jgi:DNA mismatch repair ATPase MutS